MNWQPVLELDVNRQINAGSAEQLRAAIARGADLRIYSEFRHNEHIDTYSSDDELVRETMDMRVTYLIEARWCAGILTLRQPVELPHGFGPRPSLSLFLYNENGEQAIARPFLDGPPAVGEFGPALPGDHRAIPKYHELDNWDAATNAPSSNFIYDFDVIRYFVRDDWSLALHHAADGEVVSGSIDALADAFSQGAEVKIGIRGLCADLAAEPEQSLDHEVFVQTGSCYYYTRRKLFIAGSHPLVRVVPSVPLRYGSRCWDYAWLVLRTDGHLAKLVYDPYTLRPVRSNGNYEVRWFCR